MPSRRLERPYSRVSQLPAIRWSYCPDRSGTPQLYWGTPATAVVHVNVAAAIYVVTDMYSVPGTRHVYSGSTKPRIAVVLLSTLFLLQENKGYSTYYSCYVLERSRPRVLLLYCCIDGRTRRMLHCFDYCVVLSYFF